MNTSVDEKIKKPQYLPISLDSLKLDTLLNFNLFIKRETGYFLYRDSQLPFTEETRQSLLKRNIRKLYVPFEDHSCYQNYIEDNLASIIKSKDIDKEVKSKMVYNTTREIMQEVLSHPSASESIERSQNVVESTVAFTLNDTTAFKNIIETMSLEYHIYTHSVNVCIYSLALAQFSGIKDDEQLKQLGFGALLHDVGKTKIPLSILDKEGSLTEDEFSTIKKHPELGLELVNKATSLPEVFYLPVIQHHERENCTGYPFKKGGKAIHTFSKIVSIADAFDAMTTRRVYKDARSSFEALGELFKEKSAFSNDLLGKFAKMLGPSGIMHD